MTNRIATLAAALAASMLALPAAAGSWPNLPAKKAPAKSAEIIAAAPEAETTSLEQYRYFYNEEKTHGKKSFAFGTAPEAKPRLVAKAAASNGFEAVGGEPGWQLSQHKYVWNAGRFAHSDECDHAIRMAQLPSPGDVDAMRKASPGS